MSALPNSSSLDAAQRQRARLVKRSERETGFKEGQFTLDGKPCRTRVTFYLGTSWWLDVEGESRRPLTSVEFARLKVML